MNKLEDNKLKKTSHTKLKKSEEYKADLYLKAKEGFFSRIFLEMKNDEKMTWLIIGGESKFEE